MYFYCHLNLQTLYNAACEGDIEACTLSIANGADINYEGGGLYYKVF